MRMVSVEERLKTLDRLAAGGCRYAKVALARVQQEAYASREAFYPASEAWYDPIESGRSLVEAYGCDDEDGLK